MIFGCKAQIKINRQIPQIVNVVIVRSTIAKKSIDNECQLLIDHIFIIWMLTTLKSYQMSFQIELLEDKKEIHMQTSPETMND